MANLNTAPAELVEKGLAARNKAKELLAKHKISYSKAYSSYCTRTGQVRMKLWGLFGTEHLTPAVKKKIEKLGFQVQYSNYLGRVANITGYF